MYTSLYNRGNCNGLEEKVAASNNDENWLQEGAFALAFKSTKFPGQLVATRRGSPLLVGIKSAGDLRSNNIPVLFSKGTEDGDMHFLLGKKTAVSPERFREAKRVLN